MHNLTWNCLSTGKAALKITELWAVRSYVQLPYWFFLRRIGLWFNRRGYTVYFFSVRGISVVMPVHIILECYHYRYGEIVNINLVRDRKTGKAKGFCFLAYEDQRSTVLAVDNFNGIKVLAVLCCIYQNKQDKTDSCVCVCVCVCACVRACVWTGNND